MGWASTFAASAFCGSWASACRAASVSTRFSSVARSAVTASRRAASTRINPIVVPASPSNSTAASPLPAYTSTRRRFRPSATRTSAASLSRSACRARSSAACRHLGRHHVSGCRPVGRLEGQAALAQRHHSRVSPAHVQPGQRRLGLAADRVQPYALGVLAFEWRLAGEQHAQHRSEAEHVRAGVGAVGLSGGLLRGHERRRAEDAAVLGETPVDVAGGVDGGDRTDGRLRVASGSLTLPARCQDFGQPPIQHLDFAERADHDVRRLQVAVDDAVGVGVADGLSRAQPATTSCPPESARRIGASWCGYTRRARRASRNVVSGSTMHRLAEQVQR